MDSAVKRYRTMAYIVGVALLVLVFVGVPLEHFGHQKTVVSLVGPLHGFLYIGYLACALDLSRRLQWTVKRTILIMLAGTIPFLSFVAERKVVAEVTQTSTSVTA